MLFNDENDKSPLPEESVRRGYQTVLDQCARLLSFGSSMPVDTGSDLTERQKALAIDDLILLSLHARRLIADTRTSDLARNVSVQTIKGDLSGQDYVFTRDGGAVAVTRLFNIIIHHRFIDILRDTRSILIKTSKLPIDVVTIVEHENRMFRAKLLVQSEGKPIFVDLTEFVLLFIDRVFNSIVDRCAEKHIFLEQSIFGP